MDILVWFTHFKNYVFQYSALYSLVFGIVLPKHKVCLAQNPAGVDG